MSKKINCKICTNYNYCIRMYNNFKDQEESGMKCKGWNGNNCYWEMAHSGHMEDDYNKELDGCAYESRGDI